MKFSGIIVLATGALATPSLTKRQSITAVGSDVAAIASAATALDSAIKAFSGVSDAPALISASNAVVSAIKKAETDSNAISQTITIQTPGVVDFVTQIQDLGTTVTTAINDLKAKQSVFASNGLCGQVLDQLKAQQSAANAFQTALISKLDDQLKQTAPALTGPINSALADGASAFQSCANSTPSTTSGSTGSTSTGAVTSSSGAAVTTSSGAAATSTCTTSTAVIVTPTASSNVTVPPTPTVIPSNGGAKQVAGFGGLLAAAFFAVAAF